MFKLFKSTDDKLDDLGFMKVEDTEYCVRYKRYISKYNHEQVIDILHKASGRHIVQSFDPRLFDTKKIGNTCVGLTYRELKLVMKKMKEKGWKS